MKKYLILLFLALALQINAQVKIACIGASITEGAGIENPQENSYPGQLQSLLGVKYKVSNYGVSSSTMLKKGNFSYWNTEAYRQALNSTPDIVFIDLGGNDAKAINRPFYGELEQDTKDMIRSFKQLSSQPRVVLLLPFVSFEQDTNQIWDQMIVREIIPRLQKAADDEKVEVLDMHSLFIDRQDLMPDSIHPEQKGSEIIAKCLFRKIDITVQFPMEQKYDSYKGLAMAGYQGWFSCPGDGSDRGWYHYWGKDGAFRPGSCTVDMWPDVSEYDKTYKTDFVFADGSPAYVMSEYDESTVKTHFRWMREYGIDGVFVQRFVAEIKRPKSYNQLNKVWHSAINAANANNRAISIMYDLSGMLPGDEQLVLEDIDAISAKYDIKERLNNPSYLHHNGKPLVAVWGIGFNDRRRYGFKEAEIIIDALIARGFSLLIGVPTHWRERNGDTLEDPELHRLILKCDIVMPWFVGRYNEDTFPRYEKLVKEDIAWCKKNKIDYAPLAFPGFSWVNMNKGSNPIPRNRGSFYWKQLSSHINNGAEMLYLAMFDEIDEGTAIFKCATEVPVGKSYFLPLDPDLGSDYYLKLAGKAGKLLKKNPFIKHMYTADPSAHVWTDGRLYVYASHDIAPPRGCDLMDQYHVFSTDDMVNWVDHGEILRSTEVPWGRPEGGFMWAPDCTYKDGTYYFYFPHPSDSKWNNSWKIGIATSKYPAKDFQVIGYVKGMESHIDPCVFMDEDGQAYIYQGGGGICLGAKLNTNMIEVDGQLQKMEGLEDFHEATWVHKRNGIYYLSYSDNHDDNWKDGTPGDNRMRYAISDHPLGPWKSMGIYMEPTNSYTNHGSIVEYNGQWYAFYHNSTLSKKNGEFNDWLRSICVDKLEYNPDGTIQMVIQTGEK